MIESIKAKFIKLLTEGYDIKLTGEERLDLFCDFCDYINNADNDYWAVNAGNTIELYCGDTGLLTFRYEDSKIIFRSFDLELYISEYAKELGDIVIGCLVFLDSWSGKPVSVVGPINNSMPKLDKTFYLENKKY